MKQLFFTLSIFLVFFAACSKDHDSFEISDCMNQKIEDFKSQPIAFAVLRINTPLRKLYWFRLEGIPIDVGEDVFTSDCEWYCNFDCYCDPSAYCNENILNFPKDTIWKK
ncbi:MAG TPA: hypothetical protein VFV79_01540 [Saprospiraceae bacterium]|nr:hypothetical protein [Saprospiraceae bacterium]